MGLGAAGLGLVLLSACSAAPECQPGTSLALRAEMLFGLSVQDGADVSPAEWQSFLDRSVTPRFPAGLTVLDGSGRWTGRDGRQSQERSKLLLIVADPAAPTSGKIEAIRAEYKLRFRQQSVGLVLTPACADF